MVINRREMSGRFAFTCVVLITLFLAACGGGGGGSTPNPPTPPTPVVQISISPTTASVAITKTQSFTATVTNTTNTAVNWSVQEANGGTVSNAGVYTAPSTTGTYHVIATSQADTTKSATATVTVTPAVQVSVNPTTASIMVNQTQDFTATVANSTNTAVSWSVQEANGGTINSSGRYTAPGVAGTYHVIATSQADNTKSATAAVTVTAPSPTISSVAPLEANEGDVYQYTLAATDPGSGTLTYSLTAAPTGAQISTAGVLTWTPSAAQSRVTNGFTVKVASTTGGQASQSWTVTPTGFVRGVVNQITAGTNGRVLTPVDLTQYGIFISSWNSATVTTLAGIGHANGTFEVAKVPAGYYALAGGWIGQPAQPKGINVFGAPFLWTDSSNLDLSYAQRGRPGPPTSEGLVSRKFNITGLTPWEISDGLTWTIPNIDETSFLSGVLQGDTAKTIYGYGHGPADASANDVGYLLQMVRGTFGGLKYSYIGTSAGPLPITDIANTETLVDAAMTAPASNISLRVKVNASEFKNLFAEKHPSATRMSTYLGAGTDPHDENQGLTIPRWETLLNFVDNLTISGQGDIDLGDLVVPNPFPSSWKAKFDYGETYGLQFTAPGATSAATLTAYVSVGSDVVPTVDSPIRPILGPISAATIDNKDFFVGQSDVSLTPTITWQAPTFGTASSYEIEVLRVYVNAGATVFESKVFYKTAARTIQLAPGLLAPNSSYVIKVKAVRQGSVDFVSAPMAFGLPMASTEAVSAMFTTTAVAGSSTAPSQTIFDVLKAKGMTGSQTMQNRVGGGHIAPIQ